MPLIIPAKAVKLMEYLGDRDTRREAGVASSPYLFANQSRCRLKRHKHFFVIFVALI